MKQESRSVQRRKALQKGESMPTFEKQETLRDLLRELNYQSDPYSAKAAGRLASIVERGEQMLEEWREAARLMQKLPFIGEMDPSVKETIRQLNERADDVERVLLGRKD